MKTINICMLIMTLLTTAIHSQELDGEYELRYWKDDVNYLENQDFVVSLKLISRDDLGETHLLTISSKKTKFNIEFKLGPNSKYWPIIVGITEAGFCRQDTYKNYIIVDLKEEYIGDIWGFSYERLFFNLENGELATRFYDDRASQMGGLIPAERLYLLYDIECSDGIKFTAKPTEIQHGSGILVPPLD